jgi:2-keto-4-pentenoate hydratase
MTGPEELRIIDSANALLNARRTCHFISDLSANLQPQSLDEAYAIQDRMIAALGEIGGWKIGAPSPDATPMFAPMPRAWIAASDCTLAGEETLNAMASCHPAIEVLESAFTDPSRATPLAKNADLQVHGGFVYGSAVANWQSIDFTKEHVVLAIDGVVRVERTGSNTAGDLLRLLPWLANEGAARTGGLRKGQWITTGSWTGNTLASPGSVVEVKFSTAGRVDLRFA